MKNQQTKSEVMSAREVMVELTSQMRGLQVKHNKQPSAEAIKAANARCNTAGKYLSFIRLHMDWAKMTGVTPKLGFLQLSDS